MKKPCDFCGTIFNVKQSDLDRGWGKTCSKSCAAKMREAKKLGIKQFVKVEISSDKANLTLEQKIFHMLSDTNENWCGIKRFNEIKKERTEELSKIIQEHLSDVGIDNFLLEINYLKFIPNVEFNFDGGENEPK